MKDWLLKELVADEVSALVSATAFVKKNEFNIVKCTFVICWVSHLISASDSQIRMTKN
jgi:hypothetical protein